MKICIDDGSTNIKLAWTENGERRNAISPNSFKSEWSAPFGGTQPADRTPRATASINRTDNQSDGRKYPGVISRITQHQGASALMTLTREHKQGGHNATH